jgi:hypothetical protein
MGDETTSWRSDPFGTHQLRFFSADGKPTLLVMDGGRTSYDRPLRQGPPSQREPRSGSESTRPLNRERPSAGSPVSTTEPEPPRAQPSSQPPTIATVVVQQMGSVFTAAAPMSAEDRDAVDPGHLRPPAPLVITELADDRSAPPVEQMDRAVKGDAGNPMSRPLKVAYSAVIAILALSALGLAYVHLRPSGGTTSAPAGGTTTTSPRTNATSPTTTTTVALPTALSPGAEAAANALVSNWSTGNKTGALTVATTSAVATLFAAPYASGMAMNRGCSTSFSPIVCTFGPPGGASPTDPIYQVLVSQAAGGWYVSGVKIEN